MQLHASRETMHGAHVGAKQTPWAAQQLNSHPGMWGRSCCQGPPATHLPCTCAPAAVTPGTPCLSLTLPPLTRLSAPCPTVRALLATPARLADPSDDTVPALLGADAPAEACGELRLAAGTALLRLARRHDARISPSSYVVLALVMQDDLEHVRRAFAGKVHKLAVYMLVRSAPDL